MSAMMAASAVANTLGAAYALSADGTHGLRFALHTPGSAEALVPAWRSLAERPQWDNAFFQPGFALAAAKHIADSPVSIATVTDTDSQLVAVAPVVEDRFGRLTEAVRIWSHSYGPLGTPLVREGGAKTALAELINGLAPRDSDRALIVPDLPLAGPAASVLMELAVEQKRPVARIEDGARAFIALAHEVPGHTLARRRRKEMGRQLRRLGDRGGLTFSTASEPSNVRHGLAEFLALEAAGWKGRRGTALASTTATAQFARKAVFERAAAGAVRIDSLQLDGRPIAIVISFVEGLTMFTWKITHDERFAAYSPGAQLMFELPQRAFADGNIEMIDSCAQPNHPMIDRLWPGRMKVGTLAIGPRRAGALFRLAETAARAEHEARYAARRMRSYAERLRGPKS